MGCFSCKLSLKIYISTNLLLIVEEVKRISGICVSVIFLVMTLMGCSGDKDFELRSGDLLFQGSAAEEGLSGAINQVTQTREANNFTHVGLVDRVHGQVKVLHASPEKGVCVEPLDSFLVNEEGQTRNTIAYRLKDFKTEDFQRVIERVRSVIGKSYNYTYIIEDGGFYCSELMWWAFKKDSVFELNPMNFKDSSGEFHEGWVNHYEELDMKIPQGKPGCNPNGMAASGQLVRIGRVK